MATETKQKPETKKTYRALGNILGEPVEGAEGATKKLNPHKLHRKGSLIDLNEKDAARLLKLKAVAPVVKLPGGGLGIAVDAGTLDAALDAAK